MIFNFGKRKSIEITNADEITDLLANKLHAKNDEVMLLTSEVDKLSQELNDKQLKIDNLAEKGERDGDIIQEYSERILELERETNELLDKIIYYQTDNVDLDNKLKTSIEVVKELEKKQHAPAKHKQEISMHKFTIKNLEKELLESKRVARNNKNYRETYEFISSDINKQSVKDVFSHNLSLWMSENDLNDVSASKLTKCNKETLRRLKTGSRGVTINTLQYFDEVLCDYFECSVYELVSLKLEGKK